MPEEEEGGTSCDSNIQAELEERDQSNELEWEEMTQDIDTVYS